MSLQTGVPPPDESCTISVSRFFRVSSVILLNIPSRGRAEVVSFAAVFRDVPKDGCKEENSIIYGLVSLVFTILR